MLPCLGIFDLSLWRDFLIAYVLVPFADSLLFVYYHLGKWWVLLYRIYLGLESGTNGAKRI